MPPAAAAMAAAHGALVGGSLTSVAPVFSSDDKLLCVPCHCAVRLYSVRTGEQVGLLAGAPLAAAAAAGRADDAPRADGTYPGHTRPITCVMAHPTNRVQVYTASLDGTLKLWDLYDESCIATLPISIAGGEGGDQFDRPAIISMVKGAADLVYLLVDPYMQHDSSSASAAAASASAAASSSSAVAAASSSSDPSSSPDRERSCRIVLFQLSKRLAFILYKCKDATALAIDPTRKLLAVLAGKTVRIYDTIHKRSKSTFKKSMPYNLTTLTFHPSEPYLTMGDEKGHILILYGYAQQQAAGKASDAQLVTQTLHWHAHRVGTLLFTQDGQYLMSGGEEGVLVLWQLETGTKHFIPRLQSHINHLAMSHDGNTYALAMGDNKLKFVSAVSNRVERVIAGLSYSAPSQHSVCAATSGTAAAPSSSSAPRSLRLDANDPSRALHIPFLYSPLHNGWFLNSAMQPGALQLYDLFADRHLMDADLLQRNALSKMESDDRDMQPRLELAALHPRGTKLATLERRSGQGSGGVAGATQSASGSLDTTVLKFWDWHAASSSFVLNTRIEPPHSLAQAHQSLVALLWHPKEQLVVSIGRDACFRIWREIKKPSAPNVRKEAAKAAAARAALAAKAAGRSAPDAIAEEEEEECYWNCTGVGHYRSYPTQGGAFSSDGSLLAVAYGQVLTLWDPFTLTLRHTLLHPSPSHPIRFVHFIPHTHFLLTTTLEALYVWNLLTLQLWWSFDLRVLGVAVHERALPKLNDKQQAEGHFAIMVMQPDEEEQTRKEQMSAHAEADGEAADGTAAPAPPSSSFRRRNTHLLLFSVHNPVPMRSWSLRDARLESATLPGSSTSALSSPILFASHPAQERSNKRREHAPQPTSLVYINYKRQLVRFDDVFGEETSHAAGGAGDVAADSAHAAMARMQSQADEISLFEQLYGKAHKPAASTARVTSAAASLAASAASAAPSSLAPGSSALASLLNAPTHILPAPSALFTAVMDGLLKKSVKQIAHGGAELTEESPSQQQRREVHDDHMADETDAPSASAQPSVAALDASLLQADSSASGQLFGWESHPALALTFDALVARMHSAELTLSKDAADLPSSYAASGAKSHSDAPAISKHKSSKKKSTAATEAAHPDESAERASSKSHSKSKSAARHSSPSPARAAKHAASAANGASHANGAAPMDIDSDEAPAPTPAHTNGTSSKSKKSKAAKA